MPFDRFIFNNISDSDIGGELRGTKTYQKSFYTTLKFSLFIDQLLFGASPKVVWGYNVLGQSCLDQGRWDEADQYICRALRACEDIGSAGYSLKVETLFNRGMLRLAAGRFDEGKGILCEVLGLAERSGTPTVEIAPVLTALGESCLQLGELDESKAYLERALQMVEQADELNGLAASVILNNLGALARDQGEYEVAVTYLERSLKASESVFSPYDPELAKARSNFAGTLQQVGRADEAVRMCERALEVFAEPGSDEHPVGVGVWDHLGVSYLQLKDFEKSEKAFRRALEIANKVLPSNHPLIATVAHNFSYLMFLTGRYEEAEVMVARSNEIMGGAHKGQGGYSAVLVGAAAVAFVQNGPEEGCKALFTAAEETWRHTVANFSTMSKREKANFTRHLKTLEDGNILYQFAFCEVPKVKAEVALRWALLAKQLFFEADRQESGALQAIRVSATPEWQQLWEGAEALRREYREVVAGGLRESSAVSLSENAARRVLLEIEEIDQRLRKMNPEYAAQSRVNRVEVRDVRDALRSGDALAEFVVFDDMLGGAMDARCHRYGVLLLTDDGIVNATDLGPAAEIDALVRKFLTELADTTPSLSRCDKFGRRLDLEPAVVAKAERRINEISEELRKKVWQPIEERLVGRKRVYIAPDGHLGLIPFEALAFSDGTGWRYLAEKDVELVYLNTGRDLARAVSMRAVGGTGSNTALFFADPDFDAEPAEVAAGLAGLSVGADLLHVSQPATLGTSSGDRPHRRKIKRNWPRVTGTREIGARAQRRLEELGWQVASYSGRDAAKERVMGVTSSPRIMQFSTHGYSLDTPKDSAVEWESPLLRSMLIFAGANRWTPENAVFYREGEVVVRESDAREGGLNGKRIDVSDGVLTAYEVTGLDLRGTDLVNLTACETGFGEITADGVVGLRQAFLLAGCRALTMSMWSIPTEETVEQIADFYSRWLSDGHSAAASPFQSFRAAQQAALVRARNSSKSGYSGHPFFWAGVIYAGDPGDLPEAPRRDEPTHYVQ